VLVQTRVASEKEQWEEFRCYDGETREKNWVSAVKHTWPRLSSCDDGMGPRKLRGTLRMRSSSPPKSSPLLLSLACCS
jgi:hypothetical protein